jgi:hypothetical protein
MKIPGMSAGKLNGSFSFFLSGYGNCSSPGYFGYTNEVGKKNELSPAIKSIYGFFYDFPLKKGTI